MLIKPWWYFLSENLGRRNPRSRLYPVLPVEKMLIAIEGLDAEAAQKKDIRKNLL
jgi:hypothetical protein